MNMPNIKKTCLHVAVALILPSAMLAQQADQPAAKPSKHMESHIGNLTGHSEAGAQLYYRYCWGCHGARGNGDGENAPYLNILPRNFVAAVFKCRSTPTGMLPLDSDLFNSLYRGFNFTNMPSWKVLTAQNRADLVAFIKTFSPRWVTEKPSDPIPRPNPS
jgi:cytochrome c1